MRTGVLLINLGTPDSPETPDVRRYLHQFLMDPHVIDIPFVARWAMVNLLILPKRPAASGAAYRKIWTERGSPLLFHTLDLARKVGSRLGEDFVVETGMRYGRPSIETALRKLQEAGVEKLVALPLYPQYSLAATETAKVELRRVLGRLGWAPPLRTIDEFYGDRAFIEAFATQIRASLEQEAADHVLFSFHGIPERHVRKTDPSGSHCLADETCCDRVVEANRHCYRAQSYATARNLAGHLDLRPGTWSVSFQSRLGRTPWIRPYTDIVYGELVGRGVKRLLVTCPSFVADCLETLEEIEIRGREQFRGLGGEELRLVPSLNSSERWVEAVSDWVVDN